MLMEKNKFVSKKKSPRGQKLYHQSLEIIYETKESIPGCQNRSRVAKLYLSITINRITSNLLENTKCAYSYDFYYLT